MSAKRRVSPDFEKMPVSYPYLTTPGRNIRYAWAGRGRVRRRVAGGRDTWGILEALKAPKKSDAQQELLKWLGDGYNPERFDVAEVNWRLRHPQ